MTHVVALSGGKETPAMSDPVKVIAKAICRCSCSACGGPEHPCWDWEAVVPEARAALAALEAHYTLLPKPPNEER